LNCKHPLNIAGVLFNEQAGSREPAKTKNMKTKCITIMALTVGLSALNTFAQPGPGSGEGGPRVRHHKIMIPPLVAALDADHDGTISAEELANASAAVKGFDKNNDGAVQLEELRPKPPEGEGKDGERKGPPPGGQRPDGERKGPRPGGPGPDGERKVFNLPTPPVIGALDANGDKTISADEIANASAALKKLDKNGDGALQKEETRPELPPREEK
jgi:hypothetical protein